MYIWPSVWEFQKLFLWQPWWACWELRNWSTSTWLVCEHFIQIHSCMGICFSCMYTNKCEHFHKWFGGYRILNKNTLTVAFRLACLQIRSRNEETINSTRNMILLAKGFLLPTLSTSILFICFWIDLVHVLATTRDTSHDLPSSRLYACKNTRKFKGLDSREITSLPDIKEVIYMALHVNHRRK